MKKKSIRDEAYRQEDVNFAWRRNEPGKTIASQDTMQLGSYNKYYDQSHYNDQTPESDDETETMVTDTVNTETATTETVNTDMVNTDMVNTDTATTETVNTDTVNTDMVNTDTATTETVNTDTATTETVNRGQNTP